MVRLVVHRSEVFAAATAAAAAVVARLFVAMLVEWLECITSALLVEVMYL